MIFRTGRLLTPSMPVSNSILPARPSSPARHDDLPDRRGMAARQTNQAHIAAVRIVCDRCGKERMIAETHMVHGEMLIGDIIAKMRHDGWPEAVHAALGHLKRADARIVVGTPRTHDAAAFDPEPAATLTAQIDRPQPDKRLMKRRPRCRHSTRPAPTGTPTLPTEHPSTRPPPSLT
jgi:hypothetical protein